MRRVEGKVSLFGTVAYAPQNPWWAPRRLLNPKQLTEVLDRLMGASIRDNILFSHEYDEAFYNLVLDGVYPEDHS
jgi:ATP-binding cassette, subfamily C (CFTR/MRP), member 1